MVAGSSLSSQPSAEQPLSLTLEILQGRGGSRQFPVKVRSLSARGVILTTGQVPGDFDLEGSAGKDSVIHLPGGEVPEIRGSLLWARLPEEGDPEVIFGLELKNANLKLRRALEEQLLAYPQDLKNLWDHWDSVYEEMEGSRAAPTVFQEKSPKPAGAAPRARPGGRAAPEHADPPDHTFYWVGAGAVLAGASFYLAGPESYRLVGVILAVYGSLTIAGKSLWSLMLRRPGAQK